MPELIHLPGFDDPFSAISHLFGAALFVVLGILLLRRGRGDRARVALLGVYAVACVALFALSGTYHMMVAGGTARLVLRRLDHAAIFVLIAGTFTPAHGILFRGPMRWAPLALVWSMAALGIVLKGAYLEAVPESLGLSLYLSTAWLGAWAVVALWRRHGWAFVRPLALGGVAYTAGAATDFLRWPVLVRGVVHPHDVFHVAVLAGALLHFAFIWRFADGRVPAPARAAVVG